MPDGAERCEASPPHRGYWIGHRDNSDTPTAALSASQAEAIFPCVLRGKATEEDARLFAARMLMELARMSIEDGLVMHGMVDMDDVHEMALDAAYRLAKQAYKFGEE